MNNLGFGIQIKPFYQNYNSRRYSYMPMFGAQRQYQRLNPRYNYNRATRVPVTSRVGQTTNASQNWHQLLRR